MDNPADQANTAETDEVLDLVPSAPLKLENMAVPGVLHGNAGAPWILYVHGAGNKPAEDDLWKAWDDALAMPEGIERRGAYWVDRNRYKAPEPDEYVDIADDDVAEDLRRQAVQADVLKGQYGARSALQRLVFGLRVKDVKDYLTDSKIRADFDQTFLTALTSREGPVVIIAHSAGSIIAYENLRKLSRGQVDVSLFLTIGSILGFSLIEEVFRELSHTPSGKLPKLEAVDRWVNVINRYDSLAGHKIIGDSELHDDYEGSYGGSVEDVKVEIKVPKVHSSTEYLASYIVQNHVRAGLGLKP